MSEKRPPFLLCILDGVGLNPESRGNAVALAKTPTLDHLFATCPHAKLLTHGPSVGLPKGQMGNSEVGHLTIGSGRILRQGLVRTTEDLAGNAFDKLPGWQKTLEAVAHARAVHLVGLVSDGGVHGHSDHVLSIARRLNQYEKPVYIHAITDGRDTPPHAGEDQLRNFNLCLAGLPYVELADLSGRYYAMDRDNRWPRTAAYYALLTLGEGHNTATIQQAFEDHASSGKSDEFLTPTSLGDPKESRIKQGDVVIFTNFRGDRMRQIVSAFLGDTSVTDLVPVPENLTLVTMDMYDTAFDGRVTVLYPPFQPARTLGEIVAESGLSQLRIAETEKYPHVTYFFNGGREMPFKGEQRELVPSPQVATYDQQPEMSLPEVREKLLEHLQSATPPEFIVLNIANGDMVGHTGDLQAAMKAVEAVDETLGDILKKLQEKDGQALVIADHGNCEQMEDAKGKPHTAHTLYDVPVIYVGNREVGLNDGTLADVAPTVLALMALPHEEEMSGKCLARF